MSFVVFETINNSMKNYHLACIEFLQSTSYTMPQEISSLRRRINNRDGNERKKKKKKRKGKKRKKETGNSHSHSLTATLDSTEHHANQSLQTKKGKIKEKGKKF